jgi:hypothetical protein
MSVPRPAMLVATVIFRAAGLGDDVRFLRGLRGVEHAMGDCPGAASRG